jgi:protein ImuB
MESGHVNRYWVCVHLPGLPLEMHARDAADEAAMLARLAAWSGQFSSFVSISAPRALVLEAGGSLKLFGGIGRLTARIKSGLRALGFTARVAAAPTPLAAELLACAGMETFVAHASELPRALGALPVEVLPLDAAQLRLLHGMGLRLIGDVMRLPRDGLARRLGPALVTVLDRALGGHADARLPFVPPARFHARLELPAPTGNLEALGFALQRLLREMEGFLRARQAGVRAFRLRFFHVGRKGVSTLFPLRKKGTDPFSATIIEMSLLHCARDAAHLLKLARTRLESVALPAAVEAIALDAAAIETLPERSRGFAWENNHAAGPISPASLAFIERLQARLGEAAVRKIECIADHRPERAYRIGTYRAAAEPVGRSAVRPAQLAACRPHGRPTGRPATYARPLWLLREPLPLPDRDRRPCLDGVLELDTERERIESGWWDGRPIARDYFIARDARGRRLWVYRDLASGGWFLQGMFG